MRHRGAIPAIATFTLVLGLAACAPDAVRSSSPFDAWTARVVQACGDQMIGSYQVGTLLGFNATEPAIVFLDTTSRLFAGAITADQWTLGVTSALNGQPGDGGVNCVLAQLPPR